MFTLLDIDYTQAEQIAEDGFTVSILLPLALCEATNRMISVKCVLERVFDLSLTSPYREIYDYSFFVTLDYMDDDRPTEELFDRDEIKKYLHEDIRQYILPIVLHITDILVRNVYPDYIYRVLQFGDMPDKALEKHLLITDILKSLNYQAVESGNDPLGRPFVVMGHA